MSMWNTLQAIGTECSELEEGSYFTVVVTDDDVATVVGIYDSNRKAQTQATRRDGPRIRAYVAARGTYGDIVVMSGPVVIGTVAQVNA